MTLSVPIKTRELPVALMPVYETPAAARPAEIPSTFTSASTSRVLATVTEPVSPPAEIVTLSPISARAFSVKLTFAIEALRPTRPTDAPITVELTGFTTIVVLSGRVIVLSPPLLTVALKLNEVMLSITLLSPMRAVTEPA